MIPKIFHFIYFPGPGIPNLNLCHYLSIKSNIEVNEPELVRFYVPEGSDLSDQHVFGKLNQLKEEYGDLIQVVSIPDFKEYKGNPVHFNSHKVDILKTEIMYRYGGIYSDIDSIAVHPIPDDWYESEVPIMCTEDKDGKVCGLCYGFFLAPSGSSFFQEILEEYVDYDFPEDKSQWKYEWGEFAVIRPLAIYNSDKTSVKVISADHFEPFYLDYESTENLFFLNRSHLIPKHCVQIHLWENRNHNIMKVISPRYFEECDSTLSYLCHQWVGSV